MDRFCYRAFLVSVPFSKSHPYSPCTHLCKVHRLIPELFIFCTQHHHQGSDSVSRRLWHGRWPCECMGLEYNMPSCVACLGVYWLSIGAFLFSSARLLFRIKDGPESTSPYAVSVSGPFCSDGLCLSNCVCGYTERCGGHRGHSCVIWS